jgi:hypothetical protein
MTHYTCEHCRDTGIVTVPLAEPIEDKTYIDALCGNCEAGEQRFMERLRQEEREALKAQSPEGERCMNPERCVPLGRCPRDPVCGN